MLKIKNTRTNVIISDFNVKDSVFKYGRALEVDNAPYLSL